MINTRQFANLKTSPEEAAPAAISTARQDRLEGIYSGFKFVFTTTIGAVVQRTAQADYFTFFSDGTVYYGLPDHGLIGFNMARACQGRQDFCGTYQLNGDQITIVLNRGTYRRPVRALPEKSRSATAPTCCKAILPRRRITSLKEFSDERMRVPERTSRADLSDSLATAVFRIKA